MRLVIDANVVMSALAKDGAVRASIRTTADALYTPGYISDEIEAHRDEIRAKTELSEHAFNGLLGNILQHIEVVPRDSMQVQLHAAARGLQAYDPDDTLYAAAALEVDGTVVSNDQAFENQSVVPHMWTSEFVERALGLGDGE